MLKTGYVALCGGDSNTPCGPADAVAQPEAGTESKPAQKRALFWSSEQGIYFTFTSQELKLGFCRAVVRTTVIILIFLIYFLAWDVCDICILLTAIGSCAATCLRIDWLGPSCWAGFFASILRGYRVGSEIAHVDVQWKL